MEKVVVLHERVKGNCYTTTQKVDIYFNFVDLVELSSGQDIAASETKNMQKPITKKVLKAFVSLK